MEIPELSLHSADNTSCHSWFSKSPRWFHVKFHVFSKTSLLIIKTTTLCDFKLVCASDLLLPRVPLWLIRV